MKRFQRLESAAILILLIALYYHYRLSWGTFALFILIPDISMVGYLKDPEVGAKTYNVGHSYFSPITLFALSLFFDHGLTSTLSLIWAIHIALDRTLGLGLKSSESFKHTHLGKL